MGPCMLTWKYPSGTTLGIYYTKGDVMVKASMDLFDVQTSQFGNVDKRVRQRLIEVDFTPDGEWEADTGTSLFPYATILPGASLLSAYGGGAISQDSLLEVYGFDGTSFKMSNAYLTKMPSLKFTATDTRIGSATFSCYNADAVSWETANSLYTLGTDAYVLTGFDRTKIRSGGCTAVWNVSALSTQTALTGFVATAFETVDGITVDFDLAYKAFEIDTNGVIDLRFQRLDLTIKGQPVGPSVTDATNALKMQGSGATRGRSIQDVVADIVINSGGTAIFTASQMSLKSVDLNYGTENNRIGNCEWVSNRTVSTGALVAAYTVNSLAA
jgi:hypothetical protein